MPIDCTPEALVAASVCLDCLDDNIEAADIYVLCEWANTVIDAGEAILGADGTFILNASGLPILQA